jgi:hypothetical protein
LHEHLSIARDDTTWDDEAFMDEHQRHREEGLLPPFRLSGREEKRLTFN